MQQQPRLFNPALGGIYRTFAPITEPLIRVVAGGSLAMQGFPILFGNIGAAAKFLEGIGFPKRLVLGVCGRRGGVRVRVVFGARVSYPRGGRADHRLSRHRHRHLSLAVRIRMGEPRDRISAVLVDRGIVFPGARRWSTVARRADWPGALMA
jgi:hypothetical protein